MDESKPWNLMDVTARVAQHFSDAAEAAYVEAWLRSLVLKEIMRQRGFSP